MPELPQFNPSVSVFHFTSKVSIAKIKKYKLATERGMTNVQHALLPTSLTDIPIPETLKVKGYSAINMAQDQPTSDDSEDNLILAHPDGRTAKKRNWSTAFSENGVGKKSTREPSSTSDLSSCESDVLASTAPRPKETAIKSAKSNDDYGDFMSYYVLDDDEQETTSNLPTEVAKSIEPPKKVVKKSAKTGGAKPRQRSRKPTLEHVTEQPNTQVKKPSHQRASLQSKVLHKAALPPKTQSRSSDPLHITTDPVPLMIQKVEQLTAALTTFGAPPPKSDSAEVIEESRADEVDSFLAIFGEETQPKSPAQVDMSARGRPDDSITCGIHFIMNALRSWAEGRIALSQAQVQAVQPMSAQRRGPGRPRKDSNDLDEIGRPMSPANLSLLDTPEGRAIEAFRTVVESGCLRMNTPVPIQLARALRNLYMQIDQIINKNPMSLQRQPWRCMSYRAQIEANKMKINSWRQSQLRLLEASILQQRAAHQQVMREIGIPSAYTDAVLYQQPRNTYATEFGIRPGGNGLILLQSQPQNTAYAIRLTQASIDAATAAEIQTFQTSSTSIPQVSQINAQAAARNLLRSGQSMKFSFAPSNTAALQAFGAAAFPALHKTRIARPSRSASTPSVNPVASRCRVEGSSSYQALPKSETAQHLTISLDESLQQAHPVAEISIAATQSNGDPADKGPHTTFKQHQGGEH